MSSSTFLGLGFVALLIDAGAQYVGWRRIAAPSLREPDLDQRKAGLKRWMIFALSYQVVVVILVVVYVALVGHTHPASAWPAPAVGAVMGTALPLQIAVMAISRAAR